MSARVWVVLCGFLLGACASGPAGSSGRSSSSPHGFGKKSSEPDALPAAASIPAGLQPLSRKELAVLEVECGRLMAEIQAPAMNMPAGTEAMFAMLDVAAKLRPGEQRQDCIDLAERDIKTQLAGMLEREAMRTLEWMSGKLHQRLARGDELCPSASPVPASLDVLRNGPSEVSHSEWERAGWERDGVACADSDWRELARRFQVEMQADPLRGTAKLITRGFLVVGGEPSELYVVITSGPNGTEISEVMRVGGVPKPSDDDEIATSSGT